ncbi:MAG TPA: hypothetical protein VJ103_00340 [Candidatus Paceibacterota bacterium]|nr:hypothetical protein [Candidatus Paceibacterota bacterium]
MNKEKAPTPAELEAKKIAAKEKWSTKPKTFVEGSGGAPMLETEVTEQEQEAQRERAKESRE